MSLPCRQAHKGCLPIRLGVPRLSYGEQSLWYSSAVARMQPETPPHPVSLCPCVTMSESINEAAAGFAFPGEATLSTFRAFLFNSHCPSVPGLS